MFDIANRIKKVAPRENAYDINILHPNEFEQLRRKNNISLELFIESVGGA